MPAACELQGLGSMACWFDLLITVVGRNWFLSVLTLGCLELHKKYLLSVGCETRVGIGLSHMVL